MSALSGKVVLVTGASGGIGRAVARLCHSQGATVALHQRSGAAESKALVRGLGARAEAFRADFARPGEPRRLVAAVLRRFGRLDLLVNNAGAVVGDDDFLDMSEKDWETTLRVNLQAPFFLAREAFRAMKGRGGRIVNVSSIAAKFGGSPRSAHYAAAKAGLEATTVALARFGAPHGVLVNTVRPGVIDTPFHGKFRKDMAARVAMVPLRRMGRPEDVARMVVYLAGPGGDFITGQTLCVTGGE